MTEGNQKYDARFLLWHPPFSMTIAAHPHLDVNAALRTAQECGQWDVAETLPQSPSRSRTLLPEPRGDTEKSTRLGLLSESLSFTIEGSTWLVSISGCSVLAT
jgi:hypothetical protein